MFKRNDYALLVAMIICIAFFCIGIVSSFVIGIVIAVKFHWAYFFYTFAGWLVCFIFWIFARLLL